VGLGVLHKEHLTNEKKISQTFLKGTEKGPLRPFFGLSPNTNIWRSDCVESVSVSENICRMKQCHSMRNRGGQSGVGRSGIPIGSFKRDIV